MPGFPLPLPWQIATDAGASATTAASIKGGRESSFDGPATCEAGMYRSAVESKRVFPLRQRSSFSMKEQGATRSTIVRLLRWSFPSTILRGVRAVVVLATKRGTGWTAAHEPQERREVVEPFVAHHNAARAVAWVFVITRVVATALRRTPLRVFPRPLASVCNQPIARHFRTETPAAFRHSVAKTVTNHVNRSSADASAPPSDERAEPRLRRRTPHDRQPTKRASSQIFSNAASSHTANYTPDCVQVHHREALCLAS